LDPGRLRDSFARVAMHGDQVALFFYSDLFLRHPETRDLFPVSMAAQRDRLLNALGQIVADADRLDELAPFLQGLGRDHRKFGALADHYGPVGESLLATLAHFSGEAWTPELAAEWNSAYQLVAQVMMDAAAVDARRNPASWDATVLSHELRTFDVAVLKVATVQPLHYLPGQSVALEHPLRPRLWRYYSMANAPREDSTIDFHVRMIDGGPVSMALTRGTDVGSWLRLGAPVGTLMLDTHSGRNVLLVAGSTGLAPIKALAEQLDGLPNPPTTHLFFGAGTAEGLYDLPALEKLAAAAPWLHVTPCVSDDQQFAGERGYLPDIVARHGPWVGCDAYLAGSTGMTDATASRLMSLGVPDNQIHIEDFGWSEP
jgi:NAD(P)H-flavin reductase/hemoglobin-like flavoprotein